MILVYMLSLLTLSEGYNYLVATPNAAKSESFLMISLAYELASAGHQVTFITGYKVPKEHTNLTEICMPEIGNVRDDLEGDTSLKSTFARYKLIEEFYTLENKAIWSDKRMMEVWKKRKTFDMLITLSWYSEGTFAFLMDNDMPIVQVCTAGYESLFLYREGNLVTPATLPSMLTSYDSHMNFWERSLNILYSLQYYYYQHKVVYKYIEPVTRLFPNFGDPWSYYDRLALTLISSTFALESPVPLLPSQIEIGNINTKKPEPLEKNLKKFVDSAGEEGIIYFSLGSISRSSDIPSHAKEVFVEAFRRVPQKVLWKYEDTDLSLSPNVLTQKWMPQQDILGHPKTKVFISHCGNFGTQEAKFYGVPVLGLPIFFDQPRNAARMEQKGYAIVLEWEDLTVEKVVNSLNILINDTQYQERMDALSKVVQDQKESPQERAVWWLEYVVRHKGAPHMQYAGKRLSLFQYLMLDVLLFWLGALLTILFGVVYAIRSLCCREKKLEERQKQANKKRQ